MIEITKYLQWIWNLVRCILLITVVHLEALLMMKIKNSYVYCRLRLC